MFEIKDLEKAQFIIDVYRNELHDQMLTCSEDKLIKLRCMIDGFKLLDNRLTNDIKSGKSDIINTLNK